VTKAGFRDAEREAMSNTTRPLGLAPSKIVAVHLNYRNRAEERGRVPAVPSYFLKPPSSLSGDGAQVLRPPGCELLCYEGEIALVIGTTARRVPLAEAERYIGWIAAANDFGVYDYRWADRGSNVLAKGQDGFTPLGPRLVPAGDLELGDLTVRTFLNGSLVQEGNSADLLFPFAYLVADLSRFITLEPGDIVLTGTPAGSRPAVPGDVVEVEVEGVGRIRNEIAEETEPIEPIGASPSSSAETRAAAYGVNAPRRAPVAEETIAALRRVSTATLTTQLQRHGISRPFLAGLRPARPDLRMVGFAHTVRYVPVREDVVEADTRDLNAQKQAIESISPGEVLVIEARGEAGAGTIGDILALRALRRGAAGIVTDGGLRDSPAVAGLEIPTYYRAPHASVLGALHHPLETNVPVTCAGVLVLPGDVLVGDAEGVVVVPAQLADEVAAAAVEQESREQFAFERVDAGESTRGLFPLAEERLAEYEAWREARQDAASNLT
jgi:2-keto-4-pentenoate hydratase/2-oxohepta-3-ene-1,7-dioic acid hydratase in catechol pathway/regulator of RNase E activity RraA